MPILPLDVSAQGLTVREGALVWDFPVRVFHWALVSSIAIAWWTASTAQSERHALAGYSVLALVVFRIAWGFAGSETARFRLARLNPRSAVKYMRSLFVSSSPEPIVGHNPLGWYSVILLILSLAVQAGTGLFLYDDAAFWGPLNGYVDEDQAALLRWVHDLNFDILKVLISLHVLAITLYRLKGRRLLLPMITGRASIPEGVAPPYIAPTIRAFILASAAAAGVAALVALA